jgi:hypothetical protein
MSQKRSADLSRRAGERAATFARDGGRCVVAQYVGRTFENAHTGERVTVPPCSGRLTFGHVKKASQGGAYDRENGKSECWFHNVVWIENAPRWVVDHLQLT